MRKFLGLPDTDPLVTGRDPDPSIIKKNPDFYRVLFCDLYL
jgi:hypothetical protein